MWDPDPRLLEEVTLPSGKVATVRRDALAVTLASETDGLSKSMPQEEPAANYLRDELRVAVDALRLGITSAATSEPLAAILCARAIIETAIRLTWLLADGSESEIRIRLARLEKRDLRLLLDASAAMDASSHWGPLVENADQLRAHLDSLDGKDAPEIRTMAREADFEWLYAALDVHSGARIRKSSGSGSVTARPRARAW